MSYDEVSRAAKQPAAKHHNITLEDRKKLSVSGVEDVESFDEREIVMLTAAGTLVISGEELSVSRLSVDSGDVTVEGMISELRYEEPAGESRSLWAKLFH